MRWVWGVLPIVAVLLLSPAMANPEHDFRVSGGKHIGDKEPLQYEIVYTQASGLLTIGPSGCTYYFPQWNWYWSPPCDYGSSYYRDYMVYFIGEWMHYEVHVKNTGHRTYQHLVVSATQEYYEDICWDGSCAKKGDAMPGSPTQTWTVGTLGPGQEVVLQGAYFAPWGTLPGLDETHLVIQHGKGADDAKGMDAPGRTLLDDPQAGVYCPPQPVTPPSA